LGDRDRRTGKQTGRRETDGQTRERESGERDRPEDSQTDQREIDRQADRDTRRETDGKKDRHTGEREKQTGRLTQKERDSQSIRPRDRPVNQNP
jgi:hypothetical protein